MRRIRDISAASQGHVGAVSHGPPQARPGDPTLYVVGVPVPLIGERVLPELPLSVPAASGLVP